MDFCYLVRQADFTEASLDAIESALEKFHQDRKVFIELGVRDAFNLPRQHSIIHYRTSIIEFGAPNGLCSSITESRHITAVKQPWRRSNRYNALSQMLLTNQRLDKLHALRAELADQGLAIPTHAPPPDPFDEHGEDEGPLDGEYVLSEVNLAATRGSSYFWSRFLSLTIELERRARYPRDINSLATCVACPYLPALTRRFLYDQLRTEADPISDDVELSECPAITTKVYVYHSAVAAFYAPSDVSGIRGMKRERIRSTPSWNKHERRDTALVVMDESKAGFGGLDVVRILLFFSFVHRGTEFQCALVHWFKRIGSQPDPITGLWIVEPDYVGGEAAISVIHLDCLVRGTHLMPVFATKVPVDFHFTDSLSCYQAFYVNKYIDYHMNEIAF